jgi:hypothetical protein
VEAQGGGEEMRWRPRTGSGKDGYGLDPAGTSGGVGATRSSWDGVKKDDTSTAHLLKEYTYMSSTVRWSQFERTVISIKLMKRLKSMTYMLNP